MAVPVCPVVSKSQAQLMAQDGTSIWTIAKWHGIFDQAGCEHRFTNTTTKRRSIHLGLRTLLYKIGRLSLPWKAKLSIGWDDGMRAGFLDYLSSGNKPLWHQRISNAKYSKVENAETSKLKASCRWSRPKVCAIAKTNGSKRILDLWKLFGVYCMKSQMHLAKTC